VKPAPAEIVQPAAPESEDALSDIHPNGGAHATPAVAPSRGPEEAEAPVAPTKDARSEMLEDYSLRYAPHSYRKWTEFQVANTALGGIAYLADFAIGASLAVTFGFTSAFWAILLAATVIFLTSFPIAYYSAKYSIDMDLITRGAGFGYFGGTVTSLIYASFTFIFFALEGSIMAQGLHVGLGVPLWLGYGVSALMIPPLVVFGMTLLSKMQMWTQPLWLIGMFLPFIVIAVGPRRVLQLDAVRRHRRRRRGVQLRRARRRRRHCTVAHRADRRAGRLPALHADEDQAVEHTLVDRRRRRGRGLGPPRRAEAARWCVPRLLHRRRGRQRGGDRARAAVPRGLRRVHALGDAAVGVMLAALPRADRSVSGGSDDQGVEVVGQDRPSGPGLPS